MTDLWSVADALDRLVLPTDEAVAGAARARVHALAAHLPAALTRVVYLESWIGQLRPRLDLIVKIDRDAIAELVRFGDQPGWARVASFARAWAAPGSLLDEGIRSAWLEFDLDPRIAPERALRAPRVFADFTRDAQCQPSVEARLDLVSEVLWALSGGRAPQTGAEPIDTGPPQSKDRDLLAARIPVSGTRESLRTCLTHLPHGASLASLCVLAGDGDQPPVVRACIVGLAGNLATYLGAIGWPGDIDVLSRRVLTPLARGQGEPISVLHLDLAPDIAPRIGLEYTFPRRGRSTSLREPDAFLDQLVARGWCTARNREALRSWPKRSVELMPHDVWHSQVVRQIAHVKLAYAPGEPVVAKAYLRATYDLLAGGTLLGGRPRMFAATAGDRGSALSDGGVPPSAAAGRGDAAPQRRDRSAIRARVRDGTAVALLSLRGVPGMTMSTAQQEALEQILTRATVDLEFRKALLHDPRKAILDGLGIRIPGNFRVKFIERHKDVDALIVLPDLVRQDGELDDCDLDAVAGGADPDPDPTLPW